ncbi:unnamed protein product [Amaranthus hypochondriacus]
MAPEATESCIDLGPDYTKAFINSTSEEGITEGQGLDHIIHHHPHHKRTTKPVYDSHRQQHHKNQSTPSIELQIRHLHDQDSAILVPELGLNVLGARFIKNH